MNTQNNEPNLFIISKETKEGKKYFNGKDQTFYSDLANATWASKNKEAQGVINLFKLAKCEVEVIKESDYVFAKANALTKITIISESLSIYLKESIANLPIKSQVMKNTHKHLKNAADSIKGLNPDFELFLKLREDDVYDVQGHYEEFIHHLAAVNLADLIKINTVLKALKKDENSMLGIAKKVLK